MLMKIFQIFIYLSTFFKGKSRDELKKFSHTKNIDIIKLEKFQRNWIPVSKLDQIYKKQLNDFFSKLSNKKIILINGAENTFSNLDAELISKHIRYNRVIEEVAFNWFHRA